MIDDANFKGNNTQTLEISTQMNLTQIFWKL